MLQKSNNEIYEKIECIEGMIITLLRSKQSNNLNRVEDEVKRRGRMTTIQIMDYVNVTRPTALGYMKKLGDKLGFIYRVGDTSKKISGVVVYEKSKVFEMHMQRLEQMFEQSQVIVFSDIMKSFGLSIQETRDFVYLVCQRSKQYRIKDENKLEKIE